MITHIYTSMMLYIKSFFFYLSRKKITQLNKLHKKTQKKINKLINSQILKKIIADSEFLIPLLFSV